MEPGMLRRYHLFVRKCVEKGRKMEIDYAKQPGFGAKQIPGPYIRMDNSAFMQAAQNIRVYNPVKQSVKNRSVESYCEPYFLSLPITLSFVLTTGSPQSLCKRMPYLLSSITYKPMRVGTPEMPPRSAIL